LSTSNWMPYNISFTAHLDTRYSLITMQKLEPKK
jgi:hypothetical protein